MSTNEGPLTQLLRRTGDDTKLEPIPPVKPIDVMPVKVDTTPFVARSESINAREAVAILDLQGVRAVARGDYGLYADLMAVAELILELNDAQPEPKPRAGRVIHSSRFEPPTVIDDRDVDFDEDLE